MKREDKAPKKNIFYINKFKMFISNNKYYLLLFITMLVISILIPLSGDDLGNYNPHASLIWSVENALNSYMTYESRISSRIAINLLCYHKWIWDILNALSITAIYWSICKLINIKTVIGHLLGMLSILLIPCAMFGQVYVWITGSCTYLFPTAIIITYFAYLFKIQKKITWKNFIIILFINLITPMFIDHCGVALVIGNVLYLLYSLKIQKKISPFFVCCLVTSIISLLIIYFSPGSANRLSTTTEFASLGLIGKLTFNIPNFFNYTFYANLFLIILMLIPVNYLIFKSIKNNLFIKWVLLFLFNIIPTYAIIYNSYIYDPFINYTASLDFYWPTELNFLNSTFAYIYLFIFLVLFIFSIWKIISNKKERFLYYIILIIGLSTNLTMLLSPTWGFRTAYFTTIFLSLTSIGLILEIIKKENYMAKDLLIFLKILSVGVIMYLLFVFVIVSHFDKVRLEKIKELYASGERNIIIKTCPIRYMWNYNPYMDFHNNNYKGYLLHKGIIGDENISITFEALDGRRHVVRGW